MRKGFQRVVALSLVAIAAHLDLCRNLHDSIDWCVTGMAIRASDLVAWMRTIVPAKTDIIAVTVETHSVLRFDRNR